MIRNIYILLLLGVSFGQNYWQFTANGAGQYGTIQEFVVPITGFYTVTAIGADGGNNQSPNQAQGGKGAIIQGDFELFEGEILKILVGQQGVNGISYCDAGCLCCCCWDGDRCFRYQLHTGPCGNAVYCRKIKSIL